MLTLDGRVLGYQTPEGAAGEIRALLASAPPADPGGGGGEAAG
jgi:hypothetical protein